MQAYWFEGRDVSEGNLLESVAAQFGLSSSSLLSSDTASMNLRSNTAEAAQRGAFGVPRYSLLHATYTHHSTPQPTFGCNISWVDVCTNVDMLSHCVNIFFANSVSTLVVDSSGALTGCSWWNVV